MIGIAGTPHGISGTLRVKVTGSGVHLREGVEPTISGVRRRIRRVRETPKDFLVDLEGVETREAAEGLRGAELLLESSVLDPLDTDEFYIHSLLGLEVAGEDGESLGQVADVIENPAHEILVIKNGTEYLVPFVSEQVLEVDIDGGRMVVRLLPGQ